MNAVSFLPVPGIPEIHPGDDLPDLLASVLSGEAREGDVLVVTHKIVSKAEGRLVSLATVEPSPLALEHARLWGRDARQVEIVLRESRRVVRMAAGLVISETRHGFVCANAGVDMSNVDGGETACLLPLDPDRSAQALCERLSSSLGFLLPVIITDSFGRPWRQGIVNVAIGVSGLAALTDYRGDVDPAGYRLSASVMATADALAAGSELVTGKVDRTPAVLVRGFSWMPGSGTARDLIIDPARNLFP